LATAQQELSQTTKQTAELHDLNEALTRELDGVRLELTISQRAHTDAADRRATVRLTPEFAMFLLVEESGAKGSWVYL